MTAMTDFTPPARHSEEWRAMKHFITGQIQNVLANEWGIGGSRNFKNQVESMIQKEISRQIENLTTNDRFYEVVADRILRAKFQNKGSARDELKAAIRVATDKAIADLVKNTIAKISVGVSVDPAPGVNDGDPKSDPRYGKF